MLSDDHMQAALLEDLITALLEGDLPPELNGITVTTESFVSKALLRSVGNSKVVTTFKVEKYTPSDENVRHLSEMITICKQLRVLKVGLEDNSDTFFHALSDNKNLRELSIQTTGKMMVLLFQTLPSTSITTLDLSKFYDSEGLGNEGSLAFKDFIDRNKVLTVLRANECGLTDEAFKGITFTHESPLRELSLHNECIGKGWTELFNALCSSCITTLDVSGNRLYGEECCTALKCLLINNKTLTVLRVGNYTDEANDDIVCCIADALSQKCSLIELTICGYTQTVQGLINLFESLYDNTTLKTLNCRNAHLTQDKPNNDVAKSVCEMLKRNQDLRNLNISDELIEGYLKEFAIAYIQRKPVLNLTVGKLEEQLVNEIEEQLVNEIEELETIDATDMRVDFAKKSGYKDYLKIQQPLGQSGKYGVGSRPAVITQDEADALQKLLEGAQVDIGDPIVAGTTTLEEVQQLRLSQSEFSTERNEEESKGNVTKSSDEGSLSSERLQYSEASVQRVRTTTSSSAGGDSQVRDQRGPQELIRRYSLTDEQLNSEIRSCDFSYLAGCFDGVTIYSNAMGLTPAEQADVIALCQREGTQAAMMKCLLFWKQHNPYAATYRALLELLLGLRKERIADEICQYLTQWGERGVVTGSD